MAYKTYGYTEDRIFVSNSLQNVAEFPYKKYVNKYYSENVCVILARVYNASVGFNNIKLTCTYISAIMDNQPLDNLSSSRKKVKFKPDSPTTV